MFRLSLKWFWLAAAALLGAGLLLNLSITLVVEGLWFSEVNYLSVFATGLGAKVVLWVMAFVLALAVFGLNTGYAWQGRVAPRPAKDSAAARSAVRRAQDAPDLFSPVQIQLWGSWLLLAGAVVLSASLAWLLSERWLEVLSWLNQAPFGLKDPLFERDLAFYIHSLPVWEALLRWSLGLWSLTGLATACLYWLKGRLWLLTSTPKPQQRPSRLQTPAQRHLLLLTGVVLLHICLGHWFSRYDLLYSQRGVIFGANYADVYAQLPANGFLTGVSLLSAGVLLWLAVRGFKSLPQRMPLFLLGGYALSALMIGFLYPQAVQAFVVLPNELKRDLPYIERNIQFTRQAFKLTDVEVRPFTLKDNLTYADIQKNSATIKNVRLWDSQPLLETYRQLQEIRPYYQFPNLDVDRYMISGELRQVMHSARELDYAQVPQRAQTWVNQHFFYTHGYGLTLSPVNVVTPEGLPDFFIKDIPPRATSAAVQAALPIDNPALYYGELTDTNVFVSTSDRELDYPQGDENVYASYTGTGGVAAGQLWQRLLYAWHFRDLRMLLANEFTPQSRLMFRRNIRTRAQTIAPFLRYDHDPYLVIADGQLFWLLDAYTTSRRYPYSEPNTALSPYAEPGEVAADFNYIRNSVKVVIDAYSGSVEFYLVDPQDPIVQTYRNIFPDLFKPLEAMPENLRRHLRYPEDLFQVQTHQYATYHMSDPQVFYNKEDQWQTPNETRRGITQPMRPYYLILKLPAQQNVSPTEEFALLSPFTPTNKENMIAWMAARCDSSEYGKLLVYEFSKQSLVFGPRQVEARINQNPQIAEQISLWNEHGSRVNQGNLLVIPIENSLLYIEPLYLEAEQSRLPQLTRVIAAYKDRVVMNHTLEESLEELFAEDSRQASEVPEPEGSPTPQPDLSEQLVAQPLTAKALQQWQQAQDALQNGNWAEYGRLQTELRQTLEQLDAQRQR